VTDTLDWLKTSPLFFLLLTLAAYRIGRELRDRTGGHAVAQPVLVAIVLIGIVLSVTNVDYDIYADGTWLIAFWLGPATVALAVPLHRNAHRLKGFVVPMLVAIPLGALVSIVTSVVAVRILGGNEELALTMAPKAATTPVSLALSGENGGIPALTAVFTIFIGIVGAVAGPAVLNLLRVRDRRARGLAMGAVSHGVGTSRSLHDNETEGAFAGLSMGLTALATSLLLPLAIHFL
jgi:predicted murein hydrolase (TIGR00659 family)